MTIRPLPPATDPMLRRLNALVGEWDMLASVDGRPTARARAVFEPWEGGAFLIHRVDAAPSDFEIPQIWVENSPFPITTIIAFDQPTQTFSYNYADARGVHRIYQMSMTDSTWSFWGQAGPEWYQRFTGTFSADGRTITGRIEQSTDRSTWELDFDQTYTKIS
jgi:hypothetical protein